MASGEGAGSLSASESAATTATRTARGRRVCGEGRGMERLRFESGRGGKAWPVSQVDSGAYLNDVCTGLGRRYVPTDQGKGREVA